MDFTDSEVIIGALVLVGLFFFILWLLANVAVYLIARHQARRKAK